MIAKTVQPGYKTPHGIGAGTSMVSPPARQILGLAATNA
jgi:hypothetical protein